MMEYIGPKMKGMKTKRYMGIGRLAEN
jgi:hypothetical protein